MLQPSDNFACSSPSKSSLEEPANWRASKFTCHERDASGWCSPASNQRFNFPWQSASLRASLPNVSCFLHCKEPAP